MAESKIVNMLSDLYVEFKEVLENQYHIHGDTVEMCSIPFTLPLTEMNYSFERERLTEFYKKLNLSLDAKWEEEKYHYEMLKYALLQKIRGVKYFFNQGLDSRKLVIFSEDCISLLQWMSRPEKAANYFNVYIRSSDAAGLLGCDLLGILYIHNAVIEEHRELNGSKTLGEIFIGSCHIYRKKINDQWKITTREGIEVNF